MLYSRLAVAIAQENVGKKVGEQCPVFKARLKIFERHFEPPLPPDNLDLKEITNPDQEWDVVNIQHTNWLAGEQMLVGQEVGERWVTLPRAYARFQFVTQAKIVSRQVEVKVIRSYANAPNIVDGLVTAEALVHGDTITVHDPFNLWADIEPNATGWAYLAFGQSDDPGTPEDESHVARYEIEECSLPTKEIEGKLKTCLMGGQSTGTAIIEYGGSPVSSYPNRSAYPNVDAIPGDELTNVSTTVELNFSNTWKLDGVASSACVLRRTTDRENSDPESYTTPKTGSASQERWEIIQVEKKIARHIKVTYGSLPAAVAWYDGFDAEAAVSAPYENCSITIEDTTNACNPGQGYAFLDTTAATPTYYIYSTESALLGPPDVIDYVDQLSFTGCCLNVTTKTIKGFCDEPDTTVQICPELQTVPVVHSISVTRDYVDPNDPESVYDALCLEMATIEVCSYTISDGPCLDYCCDADPPTPETCGECSHCDTPTDGFRLNSFQVTRTFGCPDCDGGNTPITGAAGSLINASGCTRTYNFKFQVGAGGGSCELNTTLTITREANQWKFEFGAVNIPSCVFWGSNNPFYHPASQGSCSLNTTMNQSTHPGQITNAFDNTSIDIVACTPGSP